MSSKRTASDLDRKVGLEIRRRRLAVRLSQANIADALGISFQQVQKYERGVNRMALATAVEVARALQCTVNDLIPEEADVHATGPYRCRGSEA